MIRRDLQTASQISRAFQVLDNLVVDQQAIHMPHQVTPTEVSRTKMAVSALKATVLEETSSSTHLFSNSLRACSAKVELEE